MARLAGSWSAFAVRKGGGFALGGKASNLAALGGVFGEADLAPDVSTGGALAVAVTWTASLLWPTSAVALGADLAGVPAASLDACAMRVAPCVPLATSNTSTQVTRACSSASSVSSSEVDLRRRCGSSRRTR